MNRNNLAVVFSPVIFSLDYDSKKKLKSLKSQMLANYTIAVSNKNQQQLQQQLLLQQQATTSTQQHQPPAGRSFDDNQAAGSVIKNEKDPSRRISSSASKNALQQESESAPTTTDHSEIKSSSTLANKINKAANSIVSFSTSSDANPSTSSKIIASDSVIAAKENIDSFEYMNKVVQMCVSDMIKYSMDLFTVPIENFEKLKLSVVLGSEPHSLDGLYDWETRTLRKQEFFTSLVNVDKSFWSYFDKYEDVSIYYFRNEYQQQIIKTATSSSNLNNSSSLSASTTAAQAQQHFSMTPASFASSLFIPQTNECFNDKLKLWKCCTLIKKPNLTLEKILQRLKSERFLWDDDFKEGRVVEQYDENTELYRYVISFLPPHPSRDFFELR
jgi:hypothetical protein